MKQWDNFSMQGVPSFNIQSLRFLETLSDELFEFEIPEESFFEHMHVIGGTGAGKTSWLGQLILHHVKNPKKPSLVVVDSQGSLIRRISTLKEIQDRLIYIDPEDPPGINIFEGANAMEAFGYLFSSLDIPMTGKQGVMFKFLIQLMVTVHGASMHDLYNITVDTEQYQNDIDRLPHIQRQFFKDDFDSPKGMFLSTRKEVKYRLQGIMGDPVLGRLLGSTTTELDLTDALNKGSIILIDTSRDVLGKEASSLYGRVFIFFLIQALYTRLPIPEQKRYPTHLLIDEAQEYFDSNVNDLLNQMRKFRCGCVFAHHNLEQVTNDLRASLASSTSIKMASGVSDADAGKLQGDLRTTKEFIKDQPPLSFATYVRTHTDHAISLPVTPGLLDKELHVIRKKKKPRSPAKEKPLTKKKPIEAKKELPKNHGNIDTSASDTW
jgi:hypothetical protein